MFQDHSVFSLPQDPLNRPLNRLLVRITTWEILCLFYALTGGQGTMVVYNRSLVCSAPEDTASVCTVLSCHQFIDLQSQHPPKVLLREVDHSSTLRAQVYDIRNRLYHKDADFNVRYAS